MWGRSRKPDTAAVASYKQFRIVTMSKAPVGNTRFVNERSAVPVVYRIDLRHKGMKKAPKRSSPIGLSSYETKRWGSRSNLVIVNEVLYRFIGNWALLRIRILISAPEYISRSKDAGLQRRLLTYKVEKSRQSEHCVRSSVRQSRTKVRPDADKLIDI